MQALAYGVAALAAITGGIAVYFLGRRSSPKNAERKPHWLGWLALFSLGIVVSLFCAGGAFALFFGVAALLRFVGLGLDSAQEFVSLLVLWPGLAIYLIAFLVGAARS